MVLSAICMFIIFRAFFFFFNDTATTEIYTLSLHDALPIYDRIFALGDCCYFVREGQTRRSEEHTSELQSQSNLVCRLLLEKKKKKKINNSSYKKKKNKKNKKKIKMILK